MPTMGNELAVIGAGRDRRSFRGVVVAACFRPGLEGLEDTTPFRAGPLDHRVACVVAKSEGKGIQIESFLRPDWIRWRQIR